MNAQNDSYNVAEQQQKNILRQHDKHLDKKSSTSFHNNGKIERKKKKKKKKGGGGGGGIYNYYYRVTVQPGITCQKQC